MIMSAYVPSAAVSSCPCGCTNSVRCWTVKLTGTLIRGVGADGGIQIVHRQSARRKLRRIGLDAHRRGCPEFRHLADTRHDADALAHLRDA